MRPPEAEAVARLVQDQNVLSGRWITPYHIYEWQPASAIPWKFQPAVTFAKMILNPLHDWDAEAFRVEDYTLFKTSLHLAMKSHGGAPLNVPIFGRPTLKLNEVVSPILSHLIERFPVALRYREFLELELPVIFSSKPEGENKDNINPGLIPAYDRIIIKPFWFFEGEGKKERAVAEDPFRLVFNISGAPIAYIQHVLQRLGVDSAKMKTVLFEWPQT